MHEFESKNEIEKQNGILILKLEMKQKGIRNQNSIPMYASSVTTPKCRGNLIT